MRTNKSKGKLTRRQRRIKHRVTLRTIFLLIITLIFNTYAWFLYVTTVSSNITAHVEAWHVQFKVDDEVVERDFPIVIEHAYPGMPDVAKTVTILNDGEKSADISYVIKSVRIFDDIYVAQDQLSSGETVPQGATQMTSEQLLQKIQNDYPFYLNITSSKNTVQADEECSLTIAFSWEYESGDDLADTDYGLNAYSYYETNPNKQAIEMIVKLLVTQHKEE